MKPKDIFEENESSLLKEAVSNHFMDVPTEHEFKLYQIEDIYDLPFINVVAKEVSIIKQYANLD